MTDEIPQIYLASASPPRRVLLEQIGVRHAPLPVTVDERRRPRETPERYVERVALAKARAGWRTVQRRDPRTVLGADTAVVVDGEVLGKPRGRAHALAMLERLSGRSHRVLTAVALVNGREATRLSASTVTFRPTTAGERAAYWDSGEPRDKAGAYAVQGRAALFIACIEGSYSGVMGLPLYETGELLREFGIDLFAFPVLSG
ncbi:MAG: septum formation inhibitor Maf [Gammaproteobacteria bacterium]|nr:septum formation inhibitor Maf [Gammaproteobacteria bacterium]